MGKEAKPLLVTFRQLNKFYSCFFVGDDHFREKYIDFSDCHEREEKAKNMSSSSVHGSYFFSYSVNIAFISFRQCTCYVQK